MADTTTELEVLDQIVDVLGGQSGQYETVVPVLQQIKELLASGITDPESIAEAVTAWLDEHPEATTTVQDGSITVMKLAQDVIELLDNKADIDGYYSQLTAGLAENLIGRGDSVLAEYLYRTAGGTADIEDGIATIDCIKGNTLVWNQLFPALNSISVSGITMTANGDGSYTLNGTATADFVSSSMNNLTLVVGHKYLVLGESGEARAQVYDTAGHYAGSIFTNTREGCPARIVVLSGKVVTNAIVYPQVFDLTLMFGAGNEPATVEEFEAMFPLPYYPYSAPKLLPVDIRGVETVGFNLLEDVSRFNATKTQYANSIFGSNTVALEAFKDNLRKLKLLGQNLYWHISADNLSTASAIPVGTLIIYGETLSITLKTIQRNTVFSLSNLDIDQIGYVVLYGPSPSTKVTFSEACISFVWSGYRNGDYEEHWSAERPIDTSHYFPTGMKKAGDKADALYADHYDTVIGAVDLGTLTWTKNTSDKIDAGHMFNAILADAAITTNKDCAKYTVIKNIKGLTAIVAEYGSTVDKIVFSASGSVGSVYVIDSTYTDAADFKAAMSGVILYYELATPTTTPIDPPLNLSYKVSDFGTERIMVDETADAPQTAPVPMEVEYGINAIDTIRRLPTEYQSHKSMGQLTAALESSLGIDITETWDETEQRYEYEATPFEIADGSITDVKLVQTGGVLAEVANIDAFLNKETSIVYSRNMFNIAAITDGLLQSDGSVVPTTNRVTSDFIPVKSGTTYRSCYWNGSGTTNLTVRACVYYDADKNIIGDGPTTSTGTFEANGLAYIRYSIAQNDATYAMLLLTDTSTSGITEFIPYSETTVISYGKKYRVVANGDSITFGHKPSADGYDGMTNGVSYMTMACEALGYDLDNYSISMSTLALDADGNDTHQALVNRYQSMSNDADLVYIAIGSNDWFYSTGTGAMQLGTSDDRTNDTFYGAMHTLCAGLKAKYGAIPIVFATPIKRWIIRDGSSIPGNLNGRSKAISEWVTAIKEVCDYYGIPVIDMYAESLLNPWLDYDRTNWVPDGTHPNKAGHEHMEITCIAALRKYLPTL